MSPDRSSPTVAIQIIILCLAVSAYNGSYKSRKIDVKDTFIQTEMEVPPIFIHCDKTMVKLMVKVLPGLAKYVSSDGKLYCHLLKSLYGCV